MASTITEIGTNSTALNVSSLAITVGSTVIPQKGDIVVLGGLIVSNASGITVSDTRGNIYNIIATPLFNTSSAREVNYYSVLYSSLQNGDTITLAWTSGAIDAAIQAIRIQGIDPLSSYDSVVTNSLANQVGLNNPATGASGVFSHIPELSLAMYAYSGTVSFAAPTNYVQTNLTNIVSAGTDASYGMSYQSITSTVSQNPTALLGGNQNAAGAIMGFKIATDGLISYDFYLKQGLQ